MWKSAIAACAAGLPKAFGTSRRIRAYGEHGGRVREIRAFRLVPPGRRESARAALLVGVSIGAITMLAPEPVHALDGTWTGPGTSWNVGTNWSSSPSTPDNIATFTNNGAPTSLSVGFGTINTIQFAAGAPAYSFTFDQNFGIGAGGIVNNSSFAPTFTIYGNFQFSGASTAGNAAIINSNMLFFANTSTAGNASINNTIFGGIVFQNSSSAGNATIINNNSLLFLNSSTAGNATISTTMPLFSRT
jgi:hypothetical protein